MIMECQHRLTKWSRTGAPRQRARNGVNVCSRLLGRLTPVQDRWAQVRAGRIAHDDGAKIRTHARQGVAADGHLLLPDGAVVTPVPFHPAVLELRSDDGWASARVTKRHPTTPEATTTTAALRDGAVYALNAHFAGMGGPQPVATFEIFRAELTR